MGITQRIGEHGRAVVATAVVVLSGLMWLIPPADVEMENSLHHLNFIPLLMAAVLTGWRGAGLTLGAIVIAQAPYIFISHRVSPENALDQVVELGIFGVASVVAGILADRERRRTAELEAATVELRRVYAELQASVEKLRRSERLYAAGQLAASLAHEIRNPLEGISGAANLLHRGKVSGQNFQDCLEIIQLESQRLNKLLSGFLEFARPRVPRFQPADVGTLIDSVRLLVAQSPLARGTYVNTEVAVGIPEVESDPEQLKQVLLNLVLNAVEASPNGSEVQIMARFDGALDRGGHVSICVVDEGPGIPAEDQEKIFEPFFTTREKGSGLGLAIAANIMQQLGGTLTAENNTTRGMRFCITLPVRREVKP